MPLTSSRKRRRVLALEDLGFDPVEIDLHIVGDAAMRPAPRSAICRRPSGRCICRRWRSSPRLRACGCARRSSSQRARSGGARLDAETPQHLAVEPFLVIGHRARRRCVDVERLDDRAFAHVAEQRDLAALARRDRPVAAAQQNVGLDADRAQFLAPSAASAWSSARRRSGCRASASGGRRPRGARGSSLPSWRIASRNGRLSMSPTVPPISHSTKSKPSLPVADEFLDRVGDVRDHLHGGAEIIAAPLRGDDVLIDAAGGDVVAAASPGAPVKRS